MAEKIKNNDEDIGRKTMSDTFPEKPYIFI